MKAVFSSNLAYYTSSFPKKKYQFNNTIVLQETSIMKNKMQAHTRQSNKKVSQKPWFERKCIGVAFCTSIMIAGMLLSAEFASAVSPQATVDGFTVTFNPLPSADITSGLIPSSLNGGPVQNYLGTSSAFNDNSPSAPTWGQTNPFNYNSTLNGSQFVAIWNNTAVYNYATTDNTLSILWGSIDNSNAVSFYNNGQLLGTIDGADLKTAISGIALPSGDIYSAAEETVDLTISVPAGFTTVDTTGGPDLTFEYSNFVASGNTATPEPATMVLFGTGLVGLAGLARRRKNA